MKWLISIQVEQSLGFKQCFPYIVLSFNLLVCLFFFLGKEVTTTQTTTSTLAHTTPSTNAATPKLPLILMKPYRPVDIPCDMLPSKTKISLWHKSLEGILSQRKPDGLSLVLQNNVFTITYGRKSDRGAYYCQEGVSGKVPIGSLTFEVGKIFVM